MLELNPDINDFLKRGGTLIVPNAQRAAAVRLAYAAAQLAARARVWATPTVLSWSGWLNRQLDEARTRGIGVPRRLSRAEVWWLWREAVRSACSEELAVLWPDGLIDAVRRAVLLLEDHGISLREAVTPEAAVLLGSQSHFTRRCEQLRAIWSGSWRACSGFIEQRQMTRLAGFPEIGPARRHWLVALGVEMEAALATAHKPFEVRALDDPEREAVAAAQWCAEQLERDPSARLLLVVTRLPERRHRWLRALSQRLDTIAPASAAPGAVALEGGEPLADYALVQLALQLLALAAGELEFAGLSAVMRSPYLSAQGRELRLRIDLWLRENNVEVTVVQPTTLVEAVERALGDTAAETLRALCVRLDSTADASPASLLTSAADWARRFAQRLERVGWPGTQLSSDEQQVRMRFEELLGEFSGILIDQAGLSARQALTLLQQLAARTAFEPATDDAPVTLTADLNDPIARYDGIWVAGLTADAWPQPLRSDPMIPWSVQRAAGMPSADPVAPLRVAEQALERWRSATGRLVLSYPRSEADLPLDPSPLLRDALALQAPPHAGAEAPFELESWLAARAPQLEALDDGLGPPWPPAKSLRGGTRLLELQALCPFRAFAELRLTATPLTEPSLGIAPMVRGQILHRALELFWIEIGDARGLHARRAELAATARACIDQALLEARQQAPVGLEPHLLRHEGVRDARLFERLIEWELTRAPFEVQALEHTQEFTAGEAPLRLRLDRVDRLVDGGLIVFDYKTGTEEPFDALAERLRRPQLPAYAVATGERTAAVTTLHLTRRGLKLRGIADRDGRLAELKGPKPDELAWPALLARWRGLLGVLTQEFLRGYAVVDPMPHACDYCHLRTLCRVQLTPTTEPQVLAPEPETP